jgi:cytochrome c553
MSSQPLDPKFAIAQFPADREKRMRRFGLVTVLLGLGVVPAACAAAPGIDQVYEQQCGSCHGVRRYGGYAPPLIPQTLGRKSDEALARAIVDGLPNTQMAAFRETVSKEQARALVAFIREPVAEITWSEADITASREELAASEGRFPEGLRRENLTLVVERGTGSVSVLDGDRMAELDRYPVGKIHGGLKFDRELRSVFASTRDGTVVAYDLLRGALRTKVKAGVNTRNIAVSPAGDFVAAANQLPSGLVIFDGDLRPLNALPLAGQPSAVYHVPGESRFLLTTRDAPLLYSIGLPGLE